ncbi:hypothetical protein ACIQK9_32315 [Streptomyces hydrogenans]|uniref:hypothetical protein n=1 Tax=Streptomyces hydrogenans TaxID=1873719 RepID=UPI0037FBB5FA
MVEHIRIGDGEPPARRLHFLDDTDRSGQIVVGHFGDHLFNSPTNGTGVASYRGPVARCTRPGHTTHTPGETFPLDLTVQPSRLGAGTDPCVITLRRLRR